MGQINCPFRLMKWMIISFNHIKFEIHFYVNFRKDIYKILRWDYNLWANKWDKRQQLLDYI